MSDNNGTPAWRPSNDVIGSVDWGNMSSWNNTYVWDVFQKPSGADSFVMRGSPSYTHISDDYTDAPDTLYIYQASSITAGYDYIKLNVAADYQPLELRMGYSVNITSNYYFLITDERNGGIASYLDYGSGYSNESSLGMVNKNRSATTKLEYWYTTDDEALVWFKTTGGTSVSIAGWVAPNSSAYTWTSILGSASLYTHGFNSAHTQLALNRGSLNTILLQKRSPIIKAHLTSSSGFIDFQELGYIPRVILVCRSFVDNPISCLLNFDSPLKNFNPSDISITYGQYQSDAGIFPESPISNVQWRNSNCYILDYNLSYWSSPNYSATVNFSVIS